MSARRPILTVGLTGGIAAGKSTVDAMFEQLGARVIDADLIVHALLASGGRAVPSVLAAFGRSVAAPDGGVDRAALGAVVFKDTTARARLELIIHPIVMEEIAVRIEAIRESSSSPIVIVDAALLVETNLDKFFDRLVVVTCREETQIERLQAARGMGRQDALQRVRAQASSEEKAIRADYRIDNDGSLERTREQVETVYRALEQDFAAKQPGSPALRGLP